MNQVVLKQALAPQERAHRAARKAKPPQGFRVRSTVLLKKFLFDVLPWVAEPQGEGKVALLAGL